MKKILFALAAVTAVSTAALADDASGNSDYLLNVSPNPAYHGLVQKGVLLGDRSIYNSDVLVREIHRLDEKNGTN